MTSPSSVAGVGRPARGSESEYTPLSVPEVEEGACLLRFSGLPGADPKDKNGAVFDPKEIVFFSYKRNSTGTEQGRVPQSDVAGSYREYPMAELIDAQLTNALMKLPPRPASDSPPPAGSTSQSAQDLPNTQSRIRIIQFTGCKKSRAKALINGTALEGSDPEGAQAQPPDVPTNHGLDLIFDSDNLDHYGEFTTGISLRKFVGTQPSQSKYFTLFISIPHLGPSENTTNSKTLHEYRFMQTATPSGSGETPSKSGKKVRVYQTWFLLFDHDTIGIFRSEGDKLATRAPLFPFQYRLGGVHALLHMLSNSITIMEKPALNSLREEASNLEWTLWSSIEDERRKVHAAAALSETPDQITAAETCTAATAATGNVESNTLLFEEIVIDISTILRLVRYQTQKLEELLRVIQNGSGPKTWNEHPRNLNPFELDVFTGNEHMKEVHTTLKWMIEEREKVLRQIDALIQDLEGTLARVQLSQTRIRGLAQVQARIRELAQGQARSTGVLLQEQAETQKKMEVSLKKQGQTISLFTFVTTIFLPLGFFCAYYAMSPQGYEQSIHNKTEFWRITGPCTAAIVALISIFLFGQDDKIKKWLKDKWSNLTNKNSLLPCFC